MPKQPHHDPRGQADRDPRPYIGQNYPGVGRIAPQLVGQNDPCVPQSNEALRAMRVLLDPCVREAFIQAMAEALKGFYQNVQMPSWERPPYTSVSGAGKIIDVTGSADVVANQNDWSTPTTLVSGDVPPGHTAVLRWRGQGTTTAAAWDFSYWRLVERQFQSTNARQPIEPYQEWQHQMGQIETPDEIWAVVHGPKTWALEVRASHIAAPTYKLFGRIKGWLYAKAFKDPGLSGTIV